MDGMGLVRAGLRVRSVVQLPWLTTLCYHRTAEVPPSAGLDSAVVDATPAQFEQQIALLAQHFSFVSIHDVVGFVQERRPLPKNPVLVTFDDGYRECLTVTLPILQRYRARAAFFIPTMFLSERRMFWWDRFAWALRHTPKDRLLMSYPEPVDLPLASTQDHAAAHRKLTNLVKTTYALDLGRMFDELHRALDVDLAPDEERRIVDDALMSWDDVGALVRADMDLGSHSHTHRVLQTLVPAAYDRELAGSRRELEERFGRPVESIAYPVGYSLKGDTALLTALQQGGYKLGFSCRSGVLPYVRPNAFDVPRFLMDTSYGAQEFAAMTSLPLLAPRSSIDVA